MLRVSVICRGRLKEKYYADACAEYLKRLAAYCQPEVIELAEHGDILSRIPKTELESFYDAIVHNATPAVTIDDGIGVLKLAYRILEAVDASIAKVQK